ncbi:uncharacterized protein [Mytilus edulis]|uniref:uncharacterized protein n=1 Tax=Mytilus edulis TaxID=6550 RepID=UPI0039EF6454
MHSSIFDNSCIAYVRFALDRLGGWTCKKHELFPVKKFANGNYEVGRLISIPRDCLSTTIAYSYFVVSGNTDMMEYIFNSNDNIRYVFVKPDDLKNTDGKLHRYDGVIRGQEVKDGVTNFFLRHTGMEAKQYRKELTEDARQSVNVFLPDWQTAKSSASGSGGEAMIMKINLIHQSLHTNYCTIMKAMWERDLVQLFKDALTKSFEPLWQEFINKKEFGKEDKKKIMLNAIAVAYLFKEYQLSVSGDEGSSLCQALLPEYGDDGKQYEIEYLKEEMPLTFHLIPKVIVHLTEVVISCLNPSWLYCMPLLHILYNQSFPGEKPKPKESVKHDYHKPIWWGIAVQDHYSFDLKKFKQKHIEEGYIKDIMDKLTPYFTMDYLLPRTLMSCIALEQLPLAAKSKWISPDIVLASLCFYVRDEKHITKHDLKEKATIDCLNAVLQKLNEENLEKSPEMLSCAFRSLMIAADVLKSMHQRYGNKLRDTVMCLALDDFLTSLHVYYTTNAELSEKSGNAAESESEGFEKTLDDVQSDVRQWLKTKMALCKSNELLPCLKAWNRVLKVVVPQGFIKDEFVKFISEGLHEALKYKRQYEEELVRVYCQNQDLFCSEMLDVLSKYVFEVRIKILKRNYFYQKSDFVILKTLN